MKKIWSLFILVSTLSLLVLSCSEIDESEKIEKPRFHTRSDEGIWIGKSDTHMPVITFTARNEIDVLVPLKPVKNPIHYIEVIVLMDGNKEIASEKIPFSYEQARAHFTLPDLIKGNYKVIAKCNMHDMWMAPVVLPSRVDKGNR
jgi:desulfoferrodoxin (superoxide reductase-like protein)